MNRFRKAIAGTALAVAAMSGGALGGGLITASANAQTATTTTPATISTPTQAAPVAPTGKFTPNENATHEAGESAAREAQEDSGQAPTVP